MRRCKLDLKDLRFARFCELLEIHVRAGKFFYNGATGQSGNGD